MNRNFKLFLSVVLIAEILVGYFIITTFINAEHTDVLDGERRITDLAINDISLIEDIIENNVFRGAAIFALQGKLLSPDDYKTYLQIDSGNLKDVIVSQRWIPRITSDERETFEDFYSQFYDANFSIRNIMFNPDTRTFDIQPIENKTEYYPFALSDPPFTLTLMGGDFSEGTSSTTFIDSLYQQSPIVATSRIRLSVPNNNRDYGVNLYKTVRTDVDIDSNISNIPIPNSSVILGQVAILVRPSIITISAFKTIGLTRDQYKFAIFDTCTCTSGELIYDSSNDNAQLSDYDGWITRDIVFVNRTYRVYVQYSEGFKDQYRTDIDTIVIITYVVVTVLLNIMMCYMYYSHRQILQAETNDIYKTLLTYVNHELRNPMVPIKGLVDLAIGNLENLKQAKDLKMIKDNLLMIVSDLYTVQGNTQLMSHIIDDVLVYRTIKEGKLKTNIDNVSVKKIVKNLKNTVSAKILENPDVQYISPEMTEDIIIKGDEVRIYQILLNLMSNSIKFTNEGSIRLGVQRDPNNKYCCFSVEDTGCGVSDGMRDLLFNEFSQESIKNSYTGSGLGLYISRNLVRLMKGTIGYKPRDDGEQGSVFYFNIPIANVMESSIV